MFEEGNNNGSASNEVGRDGRLSRGSSGSGAFSVCRHVSGLRVSINVHALVLEFRRDADRDRGGDSLGHLGNGAELVARKKDKMLPSSETVDVSFHKVTAHIFESVLKQDVEIFPGACVSRVSVCVFSCVDADLDLLNAEVSVSTKYRSLSDATGLGDQSVRE